MPSSNVSDKRPKNCKCRKYISRTEHEEGCPCDKQQRSSAILPRTRFPKFEEAMKRVSENGKQPKHVEPKEEPVMESTSNRMDKRYADEIAALDKQEAAAELVTADRLARKDECKKALAETREAEQLEDATKDLKAAQETEMQIVAAKRKAVRAWREGLLTFGDHSPGFVPERNCDKCGILTRETKAAPKDGERWCAKCMEGAPVEPNWFVKPAAV